MTRIQRHPHLLEASESGLLVVDVQEKFRPAMPGFDAMVGGCIRLVRTFQALQRPVWVTEQYPKGLGTTVPELGKVLGDFTALEKTVFSSCGCLDLLEQISDSGIRSLLVCGIETHVCVSQTVHDLLAAGYGVHVATDAVESRNRHDRETALLKMEASGAILTTAEMAAFELLVDARHPKFKEVQALFK